MEPFAPLYKASAERLPAQIRKIILDEGWIDTAINVQEPNTPMEYLFDQYMQYIDVSGEHDDFTCGQCRQAVLTEWKKLKSYLIELENDSEN